MHENPLLGGLFANSSEIPQNIRLDGWRYSDAQPSLHRNSLLTGNFTGNFANLALERLDQIRKAPVLQAFLEQFPAKLNRENGSKNRERKLKAGSEYGFDDRGRDAHC